MDSENSGQLFYHRKTVEVLGLSLGSASDIHWLSWAQANYITLPASLLEWVRRDGLHLLERYSNQDQVYQDPSLVYSSRGIQALHLITENQGDWHLGVGLDGDDPPVYATPSLRFDDTVDEEDLDGTIGRWQLLATSFSDFVFAWLIDFMVAGYDSFPPDLESIRFELWLQYPERKFIKTESLSEQDLTMLADYFEVGPITNYVPDIYDYAIHRFYKAGQIVSIARDEWQTSWAIVAKTPDAASELLETIGKIQERLSIETLQK
jgi:hypothetical protein